MFVSNKLTKCRFMLSSRYMRTLSTQNPDFSSPVYFERLVGEDKGIAIYGLNSAQTKNALGFELVESMREVNEIIRNDTKLSVVILRSMIPGIFCAGNIIYIFPNNLYVENMLLVLFLFTNCI